MAHHIFHAPESTLKKSYSFHQNNEPKDLKLKCMFNVYYYVLLLDFIRIVFKNCILINIGSG